MNVVFFGTPEFSIPSLKTLLASAYEVSLVVTQPDRRSGRGRQLLNSPVKTEALKTGLRVLQPRRVSEPDFLHELRSMHPHAIVVVAFGQILPAEIIDLPRLGCINVHASLLPKYRGAAPINWAIIHGEKKTGITTMLMDKGMDTGPILLQQETDISPEDTAGSLSLRLADIGGDLLMSTLKGLEDGSIKPGPQPGGATYAPILKKDDGFIQWTRPAVSLSDFVRGMHPWPGAYGFFEGERIKILKASPVNDDGERRSGRIVSITKDELVVGTGRGGLSIINIQSPGKPAMPIKAFLQGRVVKEGMRFDLRE